MNRRHFIILCGSTAAALSSPRSFAGKAASSPTLEQGFRDPSSASYAKTWWHWMNGNVSEVGITRDLEAMKRVGINGFQLFEAGVSIPKGPVNYDSPERVRLIRHTIAEANRLGLEFGIANCPGWSSSGGPWMTERPDLSMQTLTWTETAVAGGKAVKVALAKPPMNNNYYKDAMVLAVPTPGDPVPSSITSSKGAVKADSLSGTGTGVTLAKAEYLQLTFTQPVEARSVSVASVGIPAPGQNLGGGYGRPAPLVALVVEASEDGRQFRKVTELMVPAGPQRGGGSLPGGLPLAAVDNIAPVRARYFRVVAPAARRITQFQVSESPRDAGWDTKAQFSSGNRRAGTAAPAAAGSQAAIDLKSVVDLSSSMDATGTLAWQAPAGNWTVFRIGHTTNGIENHPAPAGGVGLEVDKLNPAAYDYHFDKFFGELFAAIAPLAKQGLASSLIDSYEIGLQNWTAQLPQEFQKRRGYDMKPYMPAMFGRVVGDQETTDRFLWDFRKTTAELMNENYYGRFAADLHARGMKAYNEPYGSGNFDEMQAGSKTDMVMGEFWPGRSPMGNDIKLVASVGHIYGKNLIGAESFTGQTKWQNHPYMLKTYGDYAFTLGLNQLIFHRFAHQPHPDVTPGMTMGPWGWEFDRTNTWFDKADGWLKGYVARCQYLLRQGAFVGDVLYFNGEDSPVRAQTLDQLQPALPVGHDWDSIDGAAIQARVTLDRGRIVLPGELTYQVLVLADVRQMTLPLATKLRDLVRQGMTLVVNSKPTGTPGLTTGDNAALQAMVAQLWGDLNGTSVQEHTLGRGRVFWGQPLRAVLDKVGVKPDFEFTAQSADAPIHYIHRRTPDADIYFVAGRRREVEDLVCTFRVTGKQPELWDAVTGEMVKAAVFDQVDGRTRMPLRLERAGSMFVVFRTAAPARRVVEIATSNKAVLTTKPYALPTAGRYRDVSGNFTLSVWLKPEYEATPPVRATLAEPLGQGPVDACPLTYVVYPPAGQTLYGANHAACGVGAARDGVVVFERSTDVPEPVVTARVPLAGWTHVAVVYRDSAPQLYVNGKPVGDAAKSGKTVHPGVGESYGSPYYFLGQYTDPQVLPEAVSESRLQEMYAAGVPAPEAPPAVESAGAARNELRVWQNGSYAVAMSSGKTASLQVADVAEPMPVAGPWNVSFQAGRGAPAQVSLPTLQSLHRHDDPAVRYFSGTATYTRTVTVPASAMGQGKRVYLDLGRVEVVATVMVNGKPAGNVWKPPYRVDMTDLVRSGDNEVNIEVANLWPNRLIGDEQMPAEYKYGGGIGVGGLATPVIGKVGPIQEIPDWYIKQQPKPGPRVAFATYKWYSKDDPLFESGLLGPITLRFAAIKAVS